MSKYTYTIFDGSPNEGGSVWFHRCGVEIEANGVEEALELVDQQLAVEAAELHSSDGYEPGDRIHAIAWDTAGKWSVGQAVYTITAEDLGEDEDEDEDEDDTETDHAARLERAAALLEATDLGGDQWAYYAYETSRYYVVDAEVLESFCAYLNDDRYSDDAYSYWCAGTTAAEQPEGWEPGDEVVS